MAVSLIFKILFDQTKQVNKSFSQEKDEITQMMGKLKAAHAELENKNWTGQGANKFNEDMNNVLMPALKRLADCMQAASDSIAKAESIMHKADEDQKSIWQKLPEFVIFKFGG
jgi:WXG100 family type VII secretion target